MSAPHDDRSELDDTAEGDEATEAEEEAAPAAVDPDEVQRKLDSLLALWRAGVATVPEVARRDAGTTGPIAVADDDDDDARRDVVTSWWSMPKVRAAS